MNPRASPPSLWMHHPASEGGSGRGTTHTRGVSANAERGLRVLGFPLQVSPWFFVLLLILGAPREQRWTTEVLVGMFIWVAVGVTGVIWHELGHALAMRRYGYSPSIALHGMGGHTAWGRGPSPTAKQRLWVSLAGPFAGFALGGLVFALGLLVDLESQHWAVQRAYLVLLWVNIGWGVINLLPMLPWDGGHVVEALADRVTGGNGRKPAAVVTFLFAVPLLVWIVYTFGFSLTTLWTGFLLTTSLRIAGRAFQKEPPPRTLEGTLTRSDGPLEALARARAALTQAGPGEKLVSRVLYGATSEDWAQLGADLEHHVLPRLESPDDRATARELAAWAQLLAGDPDDAVRNVEVMRETHEPSPALSSLVALAEERWERALDDAEDLDPREEEAERALLRAYALAMLGRHEEAGDAIGRDRDRGAVVDASLFRAGRFDAAAELGRTLWERFGSPEDAYNAACSHARAGRPGESMAWLERAIDSGYTDADHLERDPDLASVRAHAGFDALLARLRS